MTKEEFRDYVEFLRSQDEISYAAYSGLIDGIDTLEQEPKTGHWIGHREHCKNLGVIPSGLGAYEWCSNCDCGVDVREWHRTDYNYCPNCGAKMQVVEE